MGFDDYVMQLAVEAKTDFKVQSFAIQEELSSPFLIAPGLRTKTSQVEGPLPSASHPPSIW